MSIITHNGTEYAIGCVFDEIEQYHYDGMDEYTAVYYDEETDSIKYEQVGYYGSDGCNLCGGSWKIDLSVEIARKMLHGVIKRNAYKDFERSVQNYKSEIHKGDKVKVVRGRKVPKGTEGTVFWTGEKYNMYSRENELICGIKQNPNDRNEKPVWVRADYLERTSEIKSPNNRERAKFIKHYIRTNYAYVLKIASEGREVYSSYGFKVGKVW